MRRRLLRFLALTAAWLALAPLAPAPLGWAAPADGGRHAPTPAWISAWGSAQQIAEPQNSLPADALHAATLRQVVHLTVGGPAIRVRVSNAFGEAPLHLLAVHVAHPGAPGSGRIDTGSDQAVLFDGRGDVLVPAGAEYTSDPLDYPVAALSDLAITLQLDGAPQNQTGHPGARASSFLAQNAPPQADLLPTPLKVEHWYFLSGIDVAVSGSRGGTLVTLGDSITDGRGATTDANNRWPDVLAQRLQHSPGTRHLAVVNAGIGGNRLLQDGLGPNTLARFDRDVLARNGVRAVIVLEGVNDLGSLTRDSPATPAQHEELVRRILGVYRQIILRAHGHGIQAIGATLLPFMGGDYYHPDAANEADRQAINAWIRESGHFDAVVDFDRITADPEHPGRLRPDFDSGDHLHPSPAGYRAMAEGIPLQLFAEHSRRSACTCCCSAEGGEAGGGGSQSH